MKSTSFECDLFSFFITNFVFSVACPLLENQFYNWIRGLVSKRKYGAASMGRKRQK